MFLLLTAISICYAYARLYLPYQEMRPDTVRLNDKILDSFPIRDLSTPIYIMIVLGPTLTGLELFYYVDFYAVEKFWFKYALSTIIKSFTLYVTPLEVPEGYIALTDKISSHFTNNEIYGRDLFFSGHTTLMYLCFANSTNIYTSGFALLGLFSMVVSLMINRVHYTIDIFIAPLIGYACHRFVECYI